jgi:hypothetical protein
MKNDLSSEEASLIEDQKFLANLSKDCEAKKQEWAERVKTRGEELVAIHDTIKILNDDDAIELFKKTLPSPSLVQVRTASEEEARKRALVALSRGHHGYDVRLLEMALQGKKVDFSKVIKMIDQMIALLAEEQADDDNKSEYCNTQIDSVEDKVKDLAKSVSDLQTSIEDRENTIASLTDEIKALHESVAALDKSVQEASEQRKQENAEFRELMTSDSAAKELLEFAKNRLNKFYAPKLYKAPPKRELSEEETIYSNMGGELEPTPAPGGIANTGVEASASFMQLSQVDAPEKAPGTWKGGYEKKAEETSGVISMINLLVRDLDKEMTEAKTQEEASQTAYEGLMADSAEKRADDVKSITLKDTAKANAQELLVKEQGDAQSQTQMMMATKKYEQQLHAECDWLLQNYDLRKSARAQERDNLKDAKAVLSGADFSFLQRSK